jgi:hypothetical protein
MSRDGGTVFGGGDWVVGAEVLGAGCCPSARGAPINVSTAKTNSSGNSVMIFRADVFMIRFSSQKLSANITAKYPFAN